MASLRKEVVGKVIQFIPLYLFLCVDVLGYMILKDENVKGIKINNKEYKLSQYADDTQMFLDRSELSLKSALVSLRKYYNISGLNINLEKNESFMDGFDV